MNHPVEPINMQNNSISSRMWEDILKKIENQRKEIEFWRGEYGLYDSYHCRCCAREKGKPHTDDCVFKY